MIQSLFSCALTPGSTYIRNGFLSSKAFSGPLPVVPIHSYVIGDTIEDFTAWISGHLGKPVPESEVASGSNITISGPFGDGNSVTNNSNATVTNTYAAVGNYYVYATMTDGSVAGSFAPGQLFLIIVPTPYPL